MSDAGRRMPAPERVAIFRALQLGDLLCAVPALRSIRTGMPAARVTLVGLPWAAVFAERFPHLVDDFVAFPGVAALPEQPAADGAFQRFIDEMRAERFDLAIQLHGDGRVTNDVVRACRASRTIGFRPAGSDGSAGLETLPYPEHLPEVRRLLALVHHLGMPDTGEHLEFPVSDADRAALRSMPDGALLTPGAYACVHPGARSADRRWAPASFGRVSDAIASQGLRIVLTGSADEADVVRAVRDEMGTPAVDLSGRTTLGTFAAVLEGAAVLVTNDTGASHLAAALGTPSVVVFSGSDPARWAPLDAARHRPIVAGVADVAAVLREARALFATVPA